VSERATDGNGLVSTPITVTNITVTQPTNLPPVAHATVSCVNNVCTFDGRTSTDENVPALVYSWNFGNGTTGSGPVPVRTYATPGTFQHRHPSIFPKRVVLFSPHPDDDVISMGGTFIRLCDQGHEVHVAYQTSGNIAVFDEAALRHADFVREYARAFGLDEKVAAGIETQIEGFLGKKKPGGLDNATGISQLIEQARTFAHEPRTQRSVVFLAVTAEEKGLLGSEYYATHPLFPAGKTAGVLNTDGGSIYGRAKNFTISGTAKLDLLDMLIAEGKKQGRYYSPDPHPEHGSFYRSDHFSFAKVGVPAISFGDGNDLVNGGIPRGEALNREYTDKHYHQPSDEWQPTWDFRGMAEDVQLLHNLGRDLANSQQWPNWSSDSEFRATRDKTAAERPAGGERG